MESYQKKRNQQLKAMQTRMTEFISEVANKLPQDYIIDSYSEDGSVKIILPQNNYYPNIKKISVSAAKIMEWNDLTTKVLETTLVGKNGLIYIEELGYEDVCLHDDNKAVLAEIIRLAQII